MQIKDIPNVKAGDMIMCSVDTYGGVKHMCHDPVVYEEGNERASFICEGTTLNYKCRLSGKKSKAPKPGSAPDPTPDSETEPDPTPEPKTKSDPSPDPKTKPQSDTKPKP